MGHMKKWSDDTQEAKAARADYARAWRAKNQNHANAMAREWRKNNPEKVKATKRRDYEKNRARYIANATTWKKAHPEKRKEYWRRYYDKHKDEVNAKSRAWAAANPEAARKAQRRNQVRRYGLTLDDFDSLVARQHNRCAICAMPGDQTTHGVLDVDHDHATGFVRGLICHNCNRAIGMMCDDAERLTAAANYLLRCRLVAVRC